MKGSGRYVQSLRLQGMHVLLESHWQSDTDTDRQCVLMLLKKWMKQPVSMCYQKLIAILHVQHPLFFTIHPLGSISTLGGFL